MSPGGTKSTTCQPSNGISIDNGTRHPMDMNFSSIDFLQKNHMTFDIKMV